MIKLDESILETNYLMPNLHREAFYMPQMDKSPMYNLVFKDKLGGQIHLPLIHLSARLEVVLTDESAVI